MFGRYHALILAATVSLNGPGLAWADDRSAGDFVRETAALVEATAALFEDVETRGREMSIGDAERFTLMPLPTSAPVETERGGRDAFDTAHGPVRHLTGYGITWYPAERLLGAVDFMGTWDNARNLVCGYVSWDLTDPETPIMDGLVVNYVDVAALTEVEADEQERLLLTANCAFGSIDPNYAAMN